MPPNDQSSSGPGPNEVTARAFDLVLALAILLVVAVPMAIVALAVKLSDPRAPVLFRQQRCGRHGRPFRIYKFRTMVRDAEAAKAALRAQSTVAWPDFRLEHDPRVTRIGRVLRTTSLDELPQLFNVLRGEMAVVGPRPTSFLCDTYAPWQTERLETRPGLTGPWQVEGRNTMDFPDRCRMEISYFRERSLRRDLAVVAATAVAVARRTGVA